MELLRSLKQSVIDFNSIIALHYLNGGDFAVEHFQLYLNAILIDIQNYALTELKTIYAVITHKGQGINKNVDKSWRMKSSCPSEL